MLRMPCRVRPSRLACPYLSTPPTPLPSRTIATEATATPVLPPASGYARLTSRRLISIAGADAAHFLQGIITSSIHNVLPTRNEVFYTGFLNATGRVLFDVFVYPDILGLGRRVTTNSLPTAPQAIPLDQAYLIDVDAAQLPLLLRHIKRYKLRSKIRHHEIDEDNAGIWQLWGGDSGASAGTSTTTPGLGGADMASLAWANTPAGTALALRDTRAPDMGYRIISKGDREPQLITQHNDLVGGKPHNAQAASRGKEPYTLVDDATYRLRRYLLGVPEGQAELLPEQALPLEANMDLMGGIDFRKGCYVGQELTIRTKHRGIVRKRVLPCYLYTGDGADASPQDAAAETILPTLYNPSGAAGTQAQDIPTGASIRTLDGDGEMKQGRSGAAGSWLAGVGNVGLALCRLQTMTDVVVPGDEPPTVWAAAEQPSKSFGISAESEQSSSSSPSPTVRVRAVAPGWLRRALEDQSKGAGH